MTTLHHNGRTLRITPEFGETRYDDCPYPGSETVLIGVKVTDDDTGEDVTDEFEDDDAVVRAAWEQERN